MAGARRLKRGIAGAVGALLLLGAAGLGLDRLFPPDLSALESTSVTVRDSEGGLLRGFTTGDGLWRLPARLERTDPLFRRMLVAYEDKRFRRHPGVDPLALARALGQLITNRRVVSGASTLTMQTARLLAPRPRTVAGKLVEMFRAVQLEARFSKDEILAIYLTLAPYGGNLEGLRAAALAYLGKEPAHLTPGEAALLVALPQSPSLLRPDRYAARARAARDKVLAAMARKGVLTPRQVAEARAEPVADRRRPLPFHAPHLARELAAGEPRRPVWHTTIDGTLQCAVEHLAGREQAALGPRAGVAVLVVENRSRRVRAYLGSADFFASARAGQVDMVRAVRSPGSALKPFIYGMAFDDLLLHPETILADTPTRFGDYRPENFRRAYHGDVTVREALQRSLNVPAVAALEGVGPGRFAARLRRAGVTLGFPGAAGRPGLPLALGGVGVTLFDMAMLYTALANGGEIAPLVVTSDDTPASEPQPLIAPAAAWYLARILEDAPPPVDFLAARHSRRPRAMAYKTGTSYGFRDAWALGYDGDHTVAVWIGRPDGTPSPDRYGRNTAAPLLFRVFGLLPEGGRPVPRRPAGVIEARNAELPQRLKRFGAGPAGLGQARARPLLITFPPDGAVVALEASAAGPEPLPLTAEGGTKPLSWIVNGRALAAPPHRRAAAWQPDGAGFVRITVIDAAGSVAKAEARLE